MKPPLRNAILLGLFWALVFVLAVLTITIPGRGDPGGAPPPGTPLSMPLMDHANNTTAPPQPPAPFILSRPGPGQNTTTWLYAPPGSSPSVIYDRIDIYAFGTNGTRYAFRINQDWMNGTVSGSYLNLTYDASGIDRGSAYLRLGNRSWSWGLLIIRHKDIGYSPSELGPGNPYDLADLIRERNRTATAVILAGALFAPPVIYVLVREWLNRRGVVPL